MRHTLAAGLIFVVACATPVSEVASEPVFDPPPDATEVHRWERPGGGSGLPTTAVIVIYAVPEGWQETRAWYTETLEDVYSLRALPDPEVARRASIGNDSRGGKTSILIQFFPVGGERMDEVPEEAISSAPQGMRTFIEVKAEKN